MPAGFTSRRRLAATGIAALITVMIATLFAAPAHAEDSNADEPIGLDAPLIVVGVAGLTWPDITPQHTPTLWDMLENSPTAAGAVTVHTAGNPVCDTGGWLALSSGRPTPSPRLGGLCSELPQTLKSSDDGLVVGWTEMRDNLAATTFAPKLGLLHETIENGGQCATAVGPGAGLALANEDGRVPNYFRSLSNAEFDCPLTIVDAGATVGEDLAGVSLKQADARVAAVLDKAPDDATVLVMSVAAPKETRAELGVAILDHPDLTEPRMLTSTATRWDGVTRLLDLPPTIAEVLDIPRPADFGGAPMRFGSERGDAAETVDALGDISVKDLTLRGMSGPTTAILEFSFIAIALLLVWRPWDKRHRSWNLIEDRYNKWRFVRWWAQKWRTFVRWARSRTWQKPALAWLQRVGIGLALFFAAFPLSLYLMGAIPWWDMGSPEWGAWLTLFVWAAVLAAVVRLIPWRSHWQAIAVLCGVSALVMSLDVIVGSPLHRGSPMGPSPIYGGRFYGFGNTTYSFFVVHTLIFATAVAAPLTRAGRKLASYTVVGVIGLVALIVDVAPTWGADIGGGLALIPAFAFLAMALNRARFTVARVLGVGLGTVGAILAIAFADWLRPSADRSHAGQFFDQLITGDAWQVIWRKAQYALNTLDTGLASRLTIILLVLAVLAMIKPERFAPALLRDALAQIGPLRVALSAVLIGLIAGAGLNDYGLRIVSLGFGAALPLVALLCHPWGRTSSPTPSLRSETSSA